MKLQLARLWASPSTLHLRVAVMADDDSWVTFKDLSIPRQVVVSELLDLDKDWVAEARSLDQPLPGMP